MDRAVFENILEKTVREQDVNIPANPSDLANVEVALGVKINPTLRAMYLRFNGFSEHDRRSFIQLWTLQQIIEENKIPIYIDSIRYISFADVLIYSDIYLIDFENENSKVLSQAIEEEVSPSIGCLLSGFSSGKWAIYD